MAMPDGGKNQGEWTEMAVVVLRRHDLDADGSLNVREMRSALTDVCGSTSLSVASVCAALDLETKLNNAAYLWTPVDFVEVHRKIMLMAAANTGSKQQQAGSSSQEALPWAAVNSTLASLDAKSEAALKQAYSNYCRLPVGNSRSSSSQSLPEGDIKMSLAQWVQLCADLGLGPPSGGLTSQDVQAAFYAANAQSGALSVLPGKGAGGGSAGASAAGNVMLTFKGFTLALGLLTPDLQMLAAHMAQSLGPSMRPRTGNDPPQPARFPLRHLDLAQLHNAGGLGGQGASRWRDASNVFKGVDAFRAAALAAGNGSGGSVAGGSGGGGFTGMVDEMLRGGHTTDPLISALLASQPSAGRGGGAGGPGSGASSRPSVIPSLLHAASGPLHSPTQSDASPASSPHHNPLTAKLFRSNSGSPHPAGGPLGSSAGMAFTPAPPPMEPAAMSMARRSSQAGAGAGASPAGSMRPLPSMRASMHAAQADADVSLAALPAVLDRLAAAEARLQALESAAGPAGSTAASVASQAAHSAAYEARIAQLEAQVQQRAIAPMAELSRALAESQASQAALSERLESLSMQLVKANSKSDALEVQMRAYEDTSRAASSAAAQLGTQLQGLLAAQASLCKPLGTSPGDDRTSTVISRLAALEASKADMDSALRALQRQATLASEAPSREVLQAALAASGNAIPGGAVTASDAGSVISMPSCSSGSSGRNTTASNNGSGSGGVDGSMREEGVHVVAIGSKEDLRLQVCYIVEAMDGMKRRISQLAGAAYLNPVDFPTRKELDGVKKALLQEMADIDARYTRVSKEVSSLGLQLPALSKLLQGGLMGASGSELVTRLAALGMARTADIKEVENYLVERLAGSSRQWDAVKRDMGDVRQEVQANMEKLAGSFNAINKDLQDARRQAHTATAPAALAALAAGTAASTGAGGGVGAGGAAGGNAQAAASEASAASAAAAASCAAAEAKAACERERAERERLERDLLTRLGRTESQLTGSLADLHAWTGGELGAVKDVMVALEQAIAQGGQEASRALLEVEGSMRQALQHVERTAADTHDLTGKVIMKMARQMTDVQVKLRELSGGSTGSGGGAASPNYNSSNNNHHGTAAAMSQHASASAAGYGSGGGAAGSYNSGGGGGSRARDDDLSMPALTRDTFAARLLASGSHGSLASDAGSIAGSSIVSSIRQTHASPIQGGRLAASGPGPEAGSPGHGSPRMFEGVRGVLAADPPALPGGGYGGGMSRMRASCAGEGGSMGGSGPSSPCSSRGGGPVGRSRMAGEGERMHEPMRRISAPGHGLA